MVKNMNTVRREEMPDSPESLERLELPNDAMAPKEHEDPIWRARAAQWKTVWPQVIARAWSDKDFKKWLIEKPREAIEKTFPPFKLSPELKLIIDVAKTGTFDPDFKPGEDGWADIPPMELKMYSPPPPPTEHRTVALTHYSETGRTYPMTSGG
jgi:ribosomally synthesized peptide (two-chain TOMM family)